MKSTKQTTDTTADIDKELLASRIADLAGTDALGLLVDYLPDHVIVRDGREDGDTLGHTWCIDVEHSDATGIWLDDRQGDIRLQLADALYSRAADLLEAAKKLREDAAS